MENSNEKELIEKLIQMNDRLSFLIGYSSAFLYETSKLLPEDQKDRYYFLKESIENILYLDKPIGKIP